jgi:RNA polymerase sigma-70 factor (sigma-E family)
VAGPEEFDGFVRGHARDLQRAAWLLTGDWQSAEDLVQASLVEVWRRWDQVDAPLAYTHRVLMTTFLRWRKRRWNGEVVVVSLPEGESRDDPLGAADLRGDLVAALRHLPDKQRSVVVLRYFAGLSEQEIAHALGCSTGSVKTHASRALARLRVEPSLQSIFAEEVHR